MGHPIYKNNKLFAQILFFMSFFPLTFFVKNKCMVRICLLMVEMHHLVKIASSTAQFINKVKVIIPQLLFGPIERNFNVVYKNIY